MSTKIRHGFRNWKLQKVPLKFIFYFEIGLTVFPYTPIWFKRDNIFHYFLFMKSSENKFFSLPVFYLIMWLMKASKNFEKIFILKAWELISFEGVKTHFGKLALKSCIFMHEKKDFKQHYDVAFDPIKILICWALQNDHENLSFVKATILVGKKMAGYTCKMANSWLCHFCFETEFSIGRLWFQ